METHEAVGNSPSTTLILIILGGQVYFQHTISGIQTMGNDGGQVVSFRPKTNEGRACYRALPVERE